MAQVNLKDTKSFAAVKSMFSRFFAIIPLQEEKPACITLMMPQRILTKKTETGIPPGRTGKKQVKVGLSESHLRRRKENQDR